MRQLTKTAPFALALVLCLYALVVAGYFVLRYDGRWTDSDTASLTKATLAIVDEGTLVPSRAVYSHGYAYQSFSAFVAEVTGQPVADLQFWVLPLVAAGLSLAAFVMYRELTGEALAGGLATLLLFSQPDFLFAVFRGSHEKITWLAVMLALYALARSFRVAGRARSFGIYVTMFYLAAFCLFSSNAFFGSSFILALAVSLLAGLVPSRISVGRGAGEVGQKTVVRLMYVLLAATVLWFLSTFYVYPAAALILEQLKGAAARSMAVTLGRVPSFDPYATLSWGWISRGAYLGLALPSFLLGGLSFVVWLRMAIGYLRHKGQPIAEPPHLLLWLLYGGFGVQMAIGIFLDRAGTIGGNLQQRLFPLVMLMAFPLAALPLSRLLQGRRGLRRGLLAVALTLFIAWTSAAALFKSTNDPALSNYWTFWTLPEDSGSRWADGHLRDRSVWLGLDGIRVATHAQIEGFGDGTRNSADAASPDAATRDFLVSDLDEQLGARQGEPLPNVLGEDRVYDNGTVRLYHLRPRTPYQR